MCIFADKAQINKQTQLQPSDNLAHTTISEKPPYTVVIHVYGAYFMMMTQQVPAMCYVPWQRWDELYEPSRAIMRGTMFPVLDKPFTGGRS